MKAATDTNIIYQGDALEQLRKLPTGIVQTCITSPPYWGLRDYGTARWEGGEEGCSHTISKNDGDPRAVFEGRVSRGQREKCLKCGARRIDKQLGLEKTPEEYVAKLVEIFREVRRVLRDDGTLWLNIGDSYASGRGSCYNPGGGKNSLGKRKKALGVYPLNRGNISQLKESNLKPKDLVGIPWMAAFALRADGWYLRSDIIWSKPSPMPESAADRPTGAHDYIFLLAKSGKALFWTHRDTGEGVRAHPKPDHRWVHKETGEETGKPQSDKKKWRRFNLWSGHDYYYDAEAIKERVTGTSHDRGVGANPKCYIKPAGWQEGDGTHDKIPKGRYKHKQNPGFSGAITGLVGTRNKRSVWEVPASPFSEAHFATFPPKLIEPCILAGSASKACSKCGAAWVRKIKILSYQRNELPQDHPNYRPGFYTDGKAGDRRSPGPGQKIVESKTIGWMPACKCNAGTKLSIVLDPFIGSGTTGLVAEQKGRRWIGIELSAEYIEMARKRLRNLQPEMFV